MPENGTYKPSKVRRGFQLFLSSCLAVRWLWASLLRIVTALQQSGLARIETDAADGRRILVSPTTKGKALLREARDRRVELVAETLGKLTASELDLLLKAAELMERALQARRSEML